VETDTGTVDIGQTETGLTIGITDYSRRVTDDFGVTTVVPRGFSRQLSARLGVPSDDVDALQQLLAGLRATPATWVADDRFASLSVRGFYKDFSLDLAAGGLSYCTLTIEGLLDSEDLDDTGADPAPEGQLSTLWLLQPETITDAVLTSSSVAEADHAEWSAGTVYPMGARVIKAATHRIYESTAAGNVGADPAGSSGKWLDVGPTNRWAMFDQALGTVTSAAGSIIVSLDVDAVSAVALLDVVAATVRVEAAGYDRTIAVGEGAVTFLDLPAGTSAILVTVTGAGTVSVGTLLAGPLVALGVTEASPTAGITDYSRKETDDFGEVTVVERAWAKRMSTRSLIRTAALDDAVSRITAVRTRPSLWIGEAGTDSLTIYGFFKDFSIEVGETVSKLSLTVEGLSKAAPLPSAPVVLVPRGPYDPATNYGAGDIVQYEGSSWVYVAALASTGNAPPSLPVESNDWWSLFVRAGSDSISGSNRVRNAMFERGVQGWTTGINTGPLTLTSFFAGLHQGVRYVKAEYDAGAAGAQFELRTHSDYTIPVKGGERLAVQLGIEGQGPIDIQHVHAHYVDAAGSVSAVYVAGVSGAQPFNTKLQVFVETPSTAVAMHLVLYVRANAAGHMTAIIAEPMVSSATEIQSGFPSFAPGPSDGQDGAPGAPGADGLTLYSWVAYADSADGTVNFATGAPGGRGYQGLAVNKTSAIESTNPADYTWSPYRGPALFGLVPHANVVVGQDYILKTGASGFWDGSAYSSEGYIGGAMAAVTANGGDDYIFGLNTDPTTDADWATIDYGLYLQGGGGLFAAESGSLIALGDYNPGHVLQVVYDNRTVTYYRSGEIRRQVSAPGSQRYYFDSSIWASGARISGIKFSPVGSAGSDGTNGTDGTDGLDALTITAVPNPIAVPSSANYTPKGAIPGFQVTVLRGATDVTGSATYGLSSSGMTGVSITGGGAVSASGMSANEGWVEVTASQGGSSTKVRVPYTKVPDGAPYVFADNGVGAPTTTTLAEVSRIDLLMGPNGTLEADANGSFFKLGSGGTISVEAYFQYSLNGGGSWTTIGSAFAVTPDIGGAGGDFAGSFSVSGSSIGLGARQTVSVRIIMRKTNTNDFISFGGTFALSWKG
jgi:hypothetical protein